MTMQDVLEGGVKLGKTVTMIVGAVTITAATVTWAYAGFSRIGNLESKDVRQDERISQLEAWKEKANEAIITTPIKLDALSKGMTELRQDVKTYLIQQK
jgi:hypothetical protein